MFNRFRCLIAVKIESLKRHQIEHSRQIEELKEDHAFTITGLIDGHSKQLEEIRILLEDQKNLIVSTRNQLADELSLIRQKRSEKINSLHLKYY